MTEALVTVIVLIAAGILGSFLNPTEEQTKPLTPPEGGAPAPADHHHH